MPPPPASNGPHCVDAAGSPSRVIVALAESKDAFAALYGICPALPTQLAMEEKNTSARAGFCVRKKRPPSWSFFDATTARAAPADAFVAAASRSTPPAWRRTPSGGSRNADRHPIASCHADVSARVDASAATTRVTPAPRVAATATSRLPTRESKVTLEQPQASVAAAAKTTPRAPVPPVTTHDDDDDDAAASKVEGGADDF